ncbi:MAG: DUF262 domain-containing protein [Bernardetiaceae bacterium]|nr:DUF262 domain-containing protein [Bernardetiaceae bacterium]
MKKVHLILPEIQSEFRLTNEEKNTWIYRDEAGSPLLSITSETGDITDFKVLQKSGELKSVSDKDILEFFLEKYIEAERDYQEQNASGIENTEDTEDNPTASENHVSKPDFDPEDITIRKQGFTVREIVHHLIEEQRIDLSPDFQRYFVWKPKVKTGLIESILLRIPLPIFYLAENHEGIYQVVDGVQRLTTLRDFLNNKFKLKDLEYLTDCEGKTFEQLAPKYQRRIEDTQLDFNIISARTSASVKTEIFKRLNLGGKPLNRQEIRNSLSTKKIRDLIRGMASSEAFITATNGSIKPLRMEDQELVMRFVGFYLAKIEKIVTYKGEMDSFLDDVLEQLSLRDSTIDFEKIRQEFAYSMQNVHYLFGSYAFRKILPKHIEKQYTPPINKSLFTAWSVLLSQYSPEQVQAYLKPNAFVNVLVNKIQEDAQYLEALSAGTNQLDKLDYSFKIADELIQTHLKSLIHA